MTMFLHMQHIRASEPNDGHLCCFMNISVKVLKLLTFKVLYVIIFMFLSIPEEKYHY